MAPIQTLALVQRGKKLVEETVSLPELGERDVLVKVFYASQNPVDVKLFDANDVNTALGCDVVGRIEQTGSEANKFSPGAVIAGILWGGHIPEIGAFNEYTIVDERYCYPVPDGIKYEDAVTVTATAATSQMALFSEDGLALDKDMRAGEPILVWGGSSSVGQYAIQIAAIHGLIPITTCSPRNYERMKELGAKHVFDYNDPEVVEKIKKVAPDLRYVYDTIGDKTSSTTASQAVRQEGGTLCTVRPGKSFTQDVPSRVKVTDVYLWSMFGADIHFKSLHRNANKNDRFVAFKFFEQLPSLLAEGKIKPNIAKVFPNGFKDIPLGFQEVRDGKVSNYKIVYKIDQTI